MAAQAGAKPCNRYLFQSTIRNPWLDFI